MEHTKTHSLDDWPKGSVPDTVYTRTYSKVFPKDIATLSATTKKNQRGVIEVLGTDVCKATFKLLYMIFAHAHGRLCHNTHTH